MFWEKNQHASKPSEPQVYPQSARPHQHCIVCLHTIPLASRVMPSRILSGWSKLFSSHLPYVHANIDGIKYNRHPCIHEAHIIANILLHVQKTKQMHYLMLKYLPCLYLDSALHSIHPYIGARQWNKSNWAQSVNLIVKGSNFTKIEAVLVVKHLNPWLQMVLWRISRV